jgi:outer membrane receptor protein involved in Fe transport
MKYLLQKCLKVPLLLTLQAICFSIAVTAQTIKGKIKDNNSDEALIGATVLLKGGAKTLTRLTGLDGSYDFKNIPAGKYTITATFTGYETARQEIDIKQGAETANIKLTSTKSNLSGVTVISSKNRESDAFARKTELNSSNILNIVSAKTIEISPDIAIGNVLQRVSGVSMVRSGSGDGQYAIIRGLANRYTYTSLNGIILPSPDPTTRSVPLDMFPANMIERVEVIKALTPNIEGNAIGGATNLVMKDAPNKFTLNGNFAVGTTTIFFNRPFSGFNNSAMNFKSPAEINGNGYAAKPSDLGTNQLNFKNISAPINIVAGISIGNQLKNKKIGYLIGASYIREYRGSNSLLYIGQSYLTNPYTSANPAPTANKTEFTAIQNRTYSYLQSRLGVQGKIGYNINSRNSLKLYGLFLQLDDNQHRAMVQNGLSGVGEIDYFDRVIFNRKNISNIALNGTHNLFKNFVADWTGSYAIATSKRPSWTDFGLFKQNAGTDTLFVSNPLKYQWLCSKDEDKTGYLNFKYTPVKNIDLAAGGMYRRKNRSSYYNKHDLNTVVPGLGVQQFSTVNNLILSFSPAQNAYADSTNAQNYDATETVSAAYIQAKFTIKNKLEILAGVREETTNQTYESQISKKLPAKSGSYDYVDVLPGLHVKYKLTNKQNLRLSYFSGISRPNIYELVPTTLSGDLYVEGGNDSLKHTTSQNIDLRYENFFTTNNYILAGVFYKRLVNPIEVAFSSLNASTTILQPTNPANAVIDYGFELIFSKFIKNFGFSGNYTYINSSVSTLKLIERKDATNKNETVLVNQERPMQGQSNHIANLSLLYKNGKKGIDAQLSMVYTGKRISIVSQYYGLDVWQRANTQVDFSLNKSFNDHHLVTFIKITNLLNTNIYQDILTENIRYNRNYPEQNSANRILFQKDEFKQSILLGVRFKL